MTDTVSYEKYNTRGLAGELSSFCGVLSQEKNTTKISIVVRVNTAFILIIISPIAINRFDFKSFNREGYKIFRTNEKYKSEYKNGFLKSRIVFFTNPAISL